MSKTRTIKSIRGVHDILPTDSPSWQHFEKTFSSLLDSYGYSEIRMPIIESTELFKRSIGEVTDIVEKEMYTFTDRNESSLTLRPEGTAGCVRAGIQHGLLYNQQQRLWYNGPMFRRERPQKGRYRQFHQVGVETFGITGPDIDAELIAMTARLWQLLGLKNIELQLNSIGSNASRQAYKTVLVEYFTKHYDALDEDSQRRLSTNPMRILDSKNPQLAKLIATAPSILDHLDDDSQQHFDQLKNLLDAMEIQYTINTRLVRGLDYYSKTVFEWVTTELGSQGTVCGGGRYDGLVEQLGSKNTPACGFGMGIERVLDLMEAQGIVPKQNKPDFYLMMIGEGTLAKGMQLAEQIRQQIPNVKLITHCGEGSFKSQIKRADKSGAKIALIIDNKALENQQIIFNPLRDREQPQQTIAEDKLIAILLNQMV
ncbi:MAG: histidine--tRNA ligase [Thiotrichaceae bacterium]|nr:histidine--tRNA ligase [Thiotrichaceae bacterium]